MTTIYQLFKTEADLEKSGIWYKITPTIAIKMARAGGANSRFTKAIEEKTRPLRKHIKGDSTKIEVLEEINALTKEAFAETVILDWEGVTDEYGHALPFSVENAKKLLKDLPDLFDELREQALAHANFQSEALEEDSKNSAPSSDTNSN